jgi:hypothetical protein
MTSTANTARQPGRLTLVLTAIVLAASGAVAGVVNTPDAAASPNNGVPCTHGVEKKSGGKWYRCENGEWVRIWYAYAPPR